MATNNLRIIYDNVVDLTTTTITASSTGGTTSTANLKKDTKSLVWRSGTGTSSAKGNLVISLAAATIIGGVILPFCNLTTTATIRVRGFTGTTPTLGGTVDAPTVSTTGATLKFDTGTISACPYQQLGLWNWGSLPLGVNAYSYGGGTYGRCWIPVVSQISCTSLVIEIVDTANTTDKYIELSRLVVGSYWTPVHNTSFGLSTIAKDLSSHQRTESGDLITSRGTRFTSMTFDMNWLTPADRLDFNRIVKGNGLPRPLFISLFPDNSSDWEKEQAHQVYGKLAQLSAIQHPIFDTYSTQVEIEGI
jgi:hypothetical protein